MSPQPMRPQPSPDIRSSAAPETSRAPALASNGSARGLTLSSAPMAHALGSYLLLAAVGFAASVLNVIAGGGSFFTLPVLIFLGLPAAVANGTNRIGVIAQNASAVWEFHRR